MGGITDALACPLFLGDFRIDIFLLCALPFLSV